MDTEQFRRRVYIEMKLLTARLTLILCVTHLVILSHRQSVLTIAMQIGLKIIPEVWHLTVFEPSDCNGDSVLSSAISDDDAEDSRLSDLFR